MRRANRRIQFQELAIRETQTRAYEQRVNLKQPIIVSWYRRVERAIRNFVAGFFRSPFSAISGLNLLNDMTMGPNQHRGAGAAKLREWFPELGTMVSTRDGKPV